MSELQAEAVEVEDVTTETTESTEATTEQPEQVSESATDTGKNQDEKITFSPDQQQHIDNIVGKKVFKAREAEREAERLRKELDDLKAQAPVKTRPEIPGLPDPLEDDYEEKIKARDKVIMDAVAFDTEDRLAKEAESARLREAEEAKARAREEAVSTFTGRAKQLGMTDEEFQASVNRVNQYGIRDDVAEYIMDDDAGPLITKYLAANPIALEQLNNMTAMQAAVHIATTIKSNASVVKQKVTEAPEPVEPLSGAGAPSERGPKGATYE